MGAFLRFAENSWGRVFNFAWSLGWASGRRSSRSCSWDDPGSTSFVLTAIGGGVVIVGIYIVANVWKEPHYKVILAWDPEAMPANWKAGRRRYFTINWIQFATTWSAFALYLVALASLLGAPAARRP